MVSEPGSEPHPEEITGEPVPVELEMRFEFDAANLTWEMIGAVQSAVVARLLEEAGRAAGQRIRPIPIPIPHVKFIFSKHDRYSKTWRTDPDAEQGPVSSTNEDVDELGTLVYPAPSEEGEAAAGKPPKHGKYSKFSKVSFP